MKDAIGRPHAEPPGKQGQRLQQIHAPGAGGGWGIKGTINSPLRTEQATLLKSTQTQAGGNLIDN